ncbi:MAG TPA: ATP-grasp domain-containing protein [Thermoguttaceae bacterium]|nr:ATP-grasp domain-containing protein [Thermoguttaceae bacterium]
MKVAVVWNSEHGRVLALQGQPCPEKYGRKAVENVADGLRMGGHEVMMLEGDVTLLDNLRDFFGLDGESWPADAMVFNMVYGLQGECRYTHIPAMLEMAGIPYTGSSPLGHALALDKVVTKVLIESAGLPTPAWMVTSDPGKDSGKLRFPLIVKPRHESTSFGLRVVRDRKELSDAIDNIVKTYEQDALVEEFIDGREVCIGILGNGSSVETFPIVELTFEGCNLRAFTWEDKMHKRAVEPQRHCPADVPEPLARRLREIAVGTFQAVHCKDYSRVDIRIDDSGSPFVLEINSMASLGGGASYVMAAGAAGYTFSSLVCRIVDVAHQRYVAAQFAGPVARQANRANLLCQTSTQTAPSEPQQSNGLRLREEFAA